MLQTLLGLAPLTVIALALGVWTAVGIVSSGRSPREDAQGEHRD